MAYMVGHPAVIGAPGDVHSTQYNPLGMRVFDSAGVEYIYLLGVASTAIGSWVNYDGGTVHATALLDSDVAATCIGRVAVATAATVASTWGWYAIWGAAISGLALTGATDAKNVWAQATAGSVDDADPSAGAANEYRVVGAYFTGAVDEDTLLATFALSYPHISGLTLD